MGRSTVLVVTEENDLHGEAIASILHRKHGVSVTRFDIGDFPQELGCYQASPQGTSHSLSSAELECVRSVWWRRPGACDIPVSLNSSEDAFRQAECDGFIQGLLWSIEALWVNKPGATRTASRKILQLEAAVKVGLPVPETLITNDPEKAAAFIESRTGDVIYKRTGVSKGEFCGTHLLTYKDMTRLCSIRQSPTTFQEYIEAEADLRIVWIAGREWAVRIDSQAGAGRVDSRLDNSVAFTPYKLPQRVSEHLARLMHHLDLTFGVIDMRIGVDKEIYFLEVNPQGQFAYLEIKTGLPIFESLASLLADPSSFRSNW